MDSPGVAVDAANIVDIVEGLAVPRGGVRVPRPIHLPLATYIVKSYGAEIIYFRGLSSWYVFLVMLERVLIETPDI